MAAVLELDGVVKRFGTKTAIDAVSFGIPAGQMVGVIGPSGAGKSTLLRLVNRLVEPSEGAIRFDGLEVTRLEGRGLRAWRARCAMIFQQFNLVGRVDVLTNVLIGTLARLGTVPAIFKAFPAADRARALDLLERLDLIESVLQRAETLSGGQQQRVAIARALMQNPELILADEPIASLDPRNSEAVMSILQTINRERGITVLCNLHDLDIARRYCDRIIGIAKGRVVFDGPPEALTAAAEREVYGDEPTRADAPTFLRRPHLAAAG